MPFSIGPGDIFIFAYSWQAEFCFNQPSYVGCYNPQEYWEYNFTLYVQQTQYKNSIICNQLILCDQFIVMAYGPSIPQEVTQQTARLSHSTAAFLLQSIMMIWSNTGRMLSPMRNHQITIVFGITNGQSMGNRHLSLTSIDPIWILFVFAERAQAWINTRTSLKLWEWSKTSGLQRSFQVSNQATVLESSFPSFTKIKIIPLLNNLLNFLKISFSVSLQDNVGKYVEASDVRNSLGGSTYVTLVCKGGKFLSGD